MCARAAAEFPPLTVWGQLCTGGPFSINLFSGIHTRDVSCTNHRSFLQITMLFLDFYDSEWFLVIAYHILLYKFMAHLIPWLQLALNAHRGDTLNLRLVFRTSKQTVDQHMAQQLALRESTRTFSTPSFQVFQCLLSCWLGSNQYLKCWEESLSRGTTESLV